MNSVLQALSISSPEAHSSLLIHNKLKFQLRVVLLRTGNYQFPLMQTSCIQQIMILSSSVFKLHLSSSISPSTPTFTCLQQFTFKGFKPSASFCTLFINTNSQGLTRGTGKCPHMYGFPRTLSNILQHSSNGNRSSTQCLWPLFRCLLHFKWMCCFI